jgi:Flp pilus assembly protein TadG
MRRLDKRGVAALEFCFIAVPLFTLMFAIIDFGRYIITQQSLRALADAGARAMMINCYTPNLVTPATAATSPADCSGDPLPSDAAKRLVAPSLFAGGITPTLTVTASGSKAAGGTLTVTASEPGFTMLVPIWGPTLNAPQAITSVPYPPS